MAESARVYYRRMSPTQTAETARLQTDTGEAWGKASNQSIPAVRAYRGPMPDGVLGTEFECDVPPEPGGQKHEARWYATTPGVTVREVGQETIIVLPIKVTRNTLC